MQKKLVGNLLMGTAGILLVLFVSSCRKESLSNKDAVKFPHSVFLGTDKGEIWNTNDGVNFRSYFTVDNTQVYDVIKVGEKMFYANSYIYRFDNEDNGNLVYPKASNYGEYNPYLNNLHYCATEDRVYVPLFFGSSPITYSDDHGVTWNGTSSADSFSTKPNVPDAALNIKEINGRGLYMLTDDQKVFRKDYFRDYWTLQPISGIGLQFGGLNQMASTGDKLVFWNVEGLLLNQKIQIVNPSTHAVVKEINPPIATYLFTIVARDENYVYLCTSSGLIGLDLTTLIYKNFTSDIPDANIYDVSIQKTTYRSDNVRNYMYVATSEGLYLSENEGESFHKIFEGAVYSLSH